MTRSNLFADIPEQLDSERFQTLLQCHNILIERIISPPATRSEPFLQSQDEWIAVLQGWAVIESGGQTVTLNSGDTLFIPSNTPHQVMDTSTTPLCIWLAVHIHRSRDQDE